LAVAVRWRRRLHEVQRALTGRLVRSDADEGSPKARTKRVEEARPPKRPFIDAEIGWFWHAVREGAGVAARHQPDVILSSAPPFTCHLIGAWLARRHGVRWVADFRDPWARAPWGGEDLTHSARGRLRRYLERLIVTRADAVILNTPALRDEFAAHYGPRLAAKFHVVTNGYDADLLGPYLVPPLRRASTRLILTHAGSLYRQRDPRPLLQAVASAIASKRIPASGIDLRFVGAVAPEFRVADTLRDLRLESVARFAPPVDHHRSLQYLAESDVLVVIQPGTHLQVPVKLYEYLPFRKPILALAPTGALSTIVRDGGLGLVVAPDDAQALEDAICHLYEQRDRLRECFHTDSSYIAQFDGEVVSRQLQRILEAVSESRNGGVLPPRVSVSSVSRP
jgi:glycosyltransferase involved in cell wall biosynthesis